MQHLKVQLYGLLLCQTQHPNEANVACSPREPIYTHCWHPPAWHTTASAVPHSTLQTFWWEAGGKGSAEQAHVLDQLPARSLAVPFSPVPTAQLLGAGTAAPQWPPLSAVTGQEHAGC